MQLSLAIETQMFKYLMHIYFDHELRKQSTLKVATILVAMAPKMLELAT